MGGEDAGDNHECFLRERQATAGKGDDGEEAEVAAGMEKSVKHARLCQGRRECSELPNAARIVMAGVRLGAGNSNASAFKCMWSDL